MEGSGEPPVLRLATLAALLSINPPDAADQLRPRLDLASDRRSSQRPELSRTASSPSTSTNMRPFIVSRKSPAGEIGAHSMRTATSSSAGEERRSSRGRKEGGEPSCARNRTG